MKRLWNVLLYPARLYEKLTDSKAALAAGIILIGLIDFFLPNAGEVYKTYFTDIAGRTAANIQFNLIAAIFVILLIGIIDVAFFSIPLYDIFKYFKKKEGLPHKASPIKVMKVYIMSHFIIIPVNIVLYYTLFQNLSEKSSAGVIILAETAFFAVMIWSSALIARGINTLFEFGPFIRRLSFLIVFTWSFLFSMVLDMQIMTWLLKIFR